VSSLAPAALHGEEVGGALSSVCASTARHTTVLSSLQGHSYASVVSPPSPRVWRSSLTINQF